MKEWKLNKKEMKLIKKTIKEEGFLIIGKSEHPKETILYLKEKEKKNGIK